jgi:hypothetical protein
MFANFFSRRKKQSLQEGYDTGKFARVTVAGGTVMEGYDAGKLLDAGREIITTRGGREKLLSARG